MLKAKAIAYCNISSGRSGLSVLGDLSALSYRDNVPNIVALPKPVPCNIDAGDCKL
jgi:hypothetical protein